MMSIPAHWRLMLLASLLAVVWLGILPRVAQWPSVQERRERHAASGLNPGAIFYSEHPASLFERAEVAVQEHPEAFW